MAGFAFAPEIGKAADDQRSTAAPGLAIPGWPDDPDSALSDPLERLGLEDGRVAKAISGVNATEEDKRQETAQTDVLPLHPFSAAHREAGEGKRTVRLFIIEEQQIQKQAYQALFGAHEGTEVLGSCGDTSPESLETVNMLVPDVVLLGVKAVKADTVGRLEVIRAANPEIGIVLLSSIYDSQGIKALRQFSANSSSGCAYLLKHTVDTIEQLTQAIHSVAEGRVIVDPSVMGELIKTEQFRTGALGELSPKALEVLSWMAKGYRNEAIARVMARDVKTIERHINNIYGTIFCDGEDSGDRRVSATLMYLRATGALSY